MEDAVGREGGVKAVQEAARAVAQVQEVQVPTVPERESCGRCREMTAAAEFASITPFPMFQATLGD